MQITEGPEKGSGKRVVELVEAGWHEGSVKFADERAEENKISIKLDLDDGRRCMFNILSKHAKSVAKAMSITGSTLEPEDLEGRAMTVRLDQYTHSDGKVWNTLADIKPVEPQAVTARSKSQRRDWKPLSEENIPF